MYYQLRIKDKLVFVGDFKYKLYNEQVHTVSILDVFYGSTDYEYLTQLLDTMIDIEILENGVMFAKLERVCLNEIEYHLRKDGVNFYGTFEEYYEDISKLEYDDDLD